MTSFERMLHQDRWTREELVEMLRAEGDDRLALFRRAVEVKAQYVQNKVYFRGLIEFSNICLKNCFYCGIRRDSKNVRRYNLSDEEILGAARFAYENDYGSIVLQSGEVDTPAFVERVDSLLRRIRELSDGALRVTLSLGEQAEETFRRWFESGAHRYLLRIEASNPELYRKLHPHDERHRFERRLEALQTLQRIGYQTGTGVMIGLPLQRMEDLADDLLFMQRFNIDMVGMGPYIEHRDTPLYAFRAKLLPLAERFDLSLKMVAALRILMKDINIAAATALQAIDKLGREKAIQVGANVIMPNITPGEYRDDYALYENKPCTDESPEDCKACLEARIAIANSTVAYGEWGDSLHYGRRTGG